MQYRDKGGSAGPTPPRVIDVKDTEAVRAHRLTRIKSIDMAAYRQRVEQALSDLFDRDPTLKKIRAGEPVTERDLESLTSPVLQQHPAVDTAILRAFYATPTMPPGERE